MIQGKEVTSIKGVVAANPAEAARIGAGVLEAGGNAFDAAVAASMACCMMRPDQTGIGGYVCAAVVRVAATGKVWSIDANGIAPAAAHERMFEVLPAGDGAGDAWLNESEFHCSVKDHANVYGPLAVSVPGMMAGMGIIHEKWGRLPWARVVEPSISLLERGFPYGDLAARISGMEKIFRRFPGAMEHLAPGGKLPAASDLWHRPGMDLTLRRVAAEGWREFYSGRIGREIVDHLRALGGIITREDFARYEPRVTEPYSTTYRDGKVHTPILTNGGISCLQALNMLERLSLPADDSPMYWHLFAEVMKRVWRDRLNYLADPAFVDVPIERLLSKDYAAGRVETIRRFTNHVDTLVPSPAHEGPNGTLHVSASDREGNLAAMTISQGYGFGSCVIVPPWGIVLGHGMARLDPRPGLVNSIASGKRPLNNTAAMIVETPERGVAIGVPGGRKIVTVMTRAAQTLIDRAATAHQVATAPRAHIETNEPLQVLESVGEPARNALAAMGHSTKVEAVICGCINGAEYIKAERSCRAGSTESAAGAE